MAGAGLLFLEMKWSGILEKRVNLKERNSSSGPRKNTGLLVESAEDFIFTVDPENRIDSLNNYTAKFLGGRPDDLIGRCLADLFPDETAEKQLDIVRLVFQLEKSVIDEFMLQRGDKQIWINANFMPLKNKAGRVSTVLCIARDITEKKQLEINLINTEKLASIGTLAAGVAHEINNPLGVILGFCDLLLRKAEQGSQEYEDLKIIEKQGWQCKQIVENLLSFARLEEPDLDWADLNQCIEEILRVVGHQLEMRHIELESELCPHPAKVHGDPRQLQQVFLNLINNAMAAMPRENGRLVIKTYLERHTRKAVALFQDNGDGHPQGAPGSYLRTVFYHQTRG